VTWSRPQKESQHVEIRDGVPYVVTRLKPQTYYYIDEDSGSDGLDYRCPVCEEDDLITEDGGDGAVDWYCEYCGAQGVL